MLEAFTLLGALAASTERVALGTLVLNVSHRQRATAVAAATVQAIAGRPTMLGLGAGSSPRQPVGGRDAGRRTNASSRPSPGVTPASRTRSPPAEHSGLRPDAELATFPLPSPPPQLHVGRRRPPRWLAGRLADGLNVPWAHPHRDELLRRRRRRRPLRRSRLVVTTYAALG